MLQFLSDNSEVILTVIVGPLLLLVVKSLLDQRKVEKKVDVVEQRTATQNGGTVGSYSEDVWHEIKDVAADLKTMREMMGTSIRNQGRLEYKVESIKGNVEEQANAIRGVEAQLSAGSSRFANHDSRLKALEESKKAS